MCLVCWEPPSHIPSADARGTFDNNGQINDAVSLQPIHTNAAAADTVLSKWWYLFAVVYVARLSYHTLTPYTAKHLLCLDNAASLQMFYNHISSWNVLI